MLSKTKGIVIHYFLYSETSIIVKIFTEDFGLQSYIVKGIRSKQSKTGLAYFQPLNQVELVVYHKENKTLHHLKEVKMLVQYQSIPSDMTKRSIQIFISELLSRSIKEESINKPLFDWLCQSLHWLDLSERNLVNFHLVFMMQLSRFLGFYPKNSTDQLAFFDLREGYFLSKEPSHPDYILGEMMTHFGQLIESSLETPEKLELSNAVRRKLLDILIHFYSLHLAGFGEMKSVKVLREVME